MRLEIYLPAHAREQREAQTIINEARQIAGLEVTVIPIGNGDLRDFYAGSVPIYLLDGELLASGHPPPEALLADLRQRMQAPGQVRPLLGSDAPTLESSWLHVDVFRDQIGRASCRERV